MHTKKNSLEISHKVSTMLIIEVVEREMGNKRNNVKCLQILYIKLSTDNEFWS